MNSRERFRETMRYGQPDRVPYLEEPIREEVLEQWRRQGMPPDADISRMFAADRLEDLEPDLDPIPKPAAWPASRAELREFRQLLDPADPARFSEGMPDRIIRWKSRDHLLMLYVHEGLFLSMGVEDWNSFVTAATLLADDPAFVQEFMEIKGRFAAGVAERLLQDVEVDAAIFSEPIGGNSGPLISPKLYETVVLRSYEPILEVLRRHGVSPIVFKTFANARLLLPSVLKWGFDCLWACEVNVESMDYRSLRSEFGTDLRLIGGIDLDALRFGKEAIRREILEKVPPLLEQGGYVPLADGRIREDIPFESYVCYRQLLDQLTRC